jgi:glyoxylase-like metal-dependent hydrolase (beta-lactamase superfamily II)
MTVRIGVARVERVVEQQLPVPFSLLTDGDDTAPVVAGPDLSQGTFQFFNQSWLVQVDGLTVLVDPCNGNGRRRRVPYFDDRDLPWLERLQEAGFTPDAIDFVFCTHLHNDHCGWNTTWAENRWVPTFARAEYLFAEAEYRRWDSGSPAPHPNTYNESVFDECVRPVMEAGQARLIVPPCSLSPSLTIEAAPGHTEGHAMLRLESEGERAYFTGDVFHHPAQVAHPELRLPGCDDPGQAVATRRALAKRLHEEGAYLFPAHFDAPHYGLVERAGDGFHFAGGHDREEQRPGPRA